MIVELLMLLAMTRIKMVIRMRNSDRHSRGCQWFPWSLRLLGWLGWPEHHIYVEQIKAWWISSVQTSRSHSLISQLGNSLISTIFCGLMSRWAMFLKMWQVEGLIKICRHVGNARFPWRKETSTWRGCKTRPPTAAAWSLGRPGNVET